MSVRYLEKVKIGNFDQGLSSDAVLETDEWQSLCATVNKNPTPPKKPPYLRESVRMIATIGGFLARKGDGEPGVKTIWRAGSTAITRYRRYLETSPFPLPI